MRVTRDLTNGIFLDYVLTFEDVFSLFRGELRASVTGLEDKDLEVQAILKLAGSGSTSSRFYGYRETITGSLQNKFGFEITRRKYLQILEKGCLFFKLDQGEITIRTDCPTGNFTFF